MATSARTRRSVQLDDVLNSSVVSRTQQKETPKQDTRFANIESNPFFKIIFVNSSKAEEKRSELAAILNKENNKEFEEFKEYLSNVREEMAKEIIELTNTETFSELQLVYGQLNQDLIDFDESMKPLTDILDALYKLRTEGRAFDAFHEIAQARKVEKELGEKLNEKSSEIVAVRNNINSLDEQIASLSTQKGFLGFGGVKQSARESIAALNVKKTEQLNKLNNIQKEVEEINSKANENGKLINDPAVVQLRELLDISTDTHKQRQQALVQNAIKFVTNAKERVNSVRGHLDHMGSRIENLIDNNTQMTEVFAILEGGVKEAIEKNQKDREALINPVENEDLLAKTQRENKKVDIERFISVLDESGKDILTTYADLSSQGIRVNTMSNANINQKTKARTLATQGIAGVADRLSVVLQAVSAAALSESSSMAKDTLIKMSDNTNKVAQKEVIRVATNIDEVNEEVMKALDDLGAYGEVRRAATEIYRKGVSELRDNLEELRKVADETIKSSHEAIAVNADVNSGKSNKQSSSSTIKPSIKSPFKMGQ